MCPCLGWCVRLPEVLSPLVSQLVSLLVYPCLRLSPIVFLLPPHTCACVGWCVRLPEVFAPLVSPHMCLCWMSCPPSLGLVSFCFPHMCACVGWPPSQGLVSPCLPTCVPVLGASAFPRFCLPLVSHCLPSCVPVLHGVSAFPRFCPPCLPACLPSCLPACLPTCLSSCFSLWWVVWFCFFPKQLLSWMGFSILARNGLCSLMICWLLLVPAGVPVLVSLLSSLVPVIVSLLLSSFFPQGRGSVPSWFAGSSGSGWSSGACLHSSLFFGSGDCLPSSLFFLSSGLGFCSIMICWFFLVPAGGPLRDTMDLSVNGSLIWLVAVERCCNFEAWVELSGPVFTNMKARWGDLISRTCLAIRAYKYLHAMVRQHDPMIQWHEGGAWRRGLRGCLRGCLRGA